MDSVFTHFFCQPIRRETEENMSSIVKIIHLGCLATKVNLAVVVYGFIKTLFDREQQCQWQFVKIASDPKPPANCAVKTILYLSCHMF